MKNYSSIWQEIFWKSLSLCGDDFRLLKFYTFFVQFRINDQKHIDFLLDMVAWAFAFLHYRECSSCMTHPDELKQWFRSGDLAHASHGVSICSFLLWDWLLCSANHVDLGNWRTSILPRYRRPQFVCSERSIFAPSYFNILIVSRGTFALHNVVLGNNAYNEVILLQR